MKKILLFVAIFAALSAAPVQAQAAADSAAIRAAALDYIEGWYSGDAERMERAVHPELAKRIVMRGPGGAAGPLRNMTAGELVAGTREGRGSRTPVERRRTDVKVLDIFENSASVRVDAGDWIDYMHLARSDAGWKIINVLWEYRPGVMRVNRRGTSGGSVS